jgi:hypothetical protein
MVAALRLGGEVLQALKQSSNARKRIFERRRAFRPLPALTPIAAGTEEITPRMLPSGELVGWF